MLQVYVYTRGPLKSLTLKFEQVVRIQKRGRWDCPKHLTIPYSDLKNNLNPTNQLQYPRLLTLRTNHTNTKITIYESTRFNFTLNSNSKWSKKLPLLNKYQTCVLFTNIKRNFFQKVAFYTNQTLFLGWLFWKCNFWASKVETNRY